MRGKYVIIGIIVLFVTVGLSGCSSINPKSNIQVVGAVDRTGYSGVDFCVFIDVTVTNNGDAGGSADVWAEVKQDVNTFEKRQNVYLDSGETKLVTLTFCEASFASMYTYRAWIE